MTLKSEIRYLKITLIDGTRFILRVTGEAPLVIRGYEVNAEGDEVVPAGYERRLRVVDATASSAPSSYA